MLRPWASAPHRSDALPVSITMTGGSAQLVHIVVHRYAVMRIGVDGSVEMLD